MAVTAKIERMHDVPTFARIEAEVGASVAKAWERFPQEVLASDRETAVTMIGELLDAWNGRIPRITLQHLAEKVAMMKSLEDTETEKQAAKQTRAAALRDQRHTGERRAA